MGIQVTALNAVMIGDRIWTIEMPPHQVRFFGNPTNAIQTRSILVVMNPQFEASERKLSFDADDAVALSVGTNMETIVVGGAIAISGREENSAVKHVFGPGDKAFLDLVRKMLPLHMQKAAEQLLSAVRRRESGDLKRGKKYNFSETPDNFWYVIIQPQVQHLQITVRGTVDHFAGCSTLDILDDRGNTRFKVKNENDVDEALKLIFRAKRKI